MTIKDALDNLAPPERAQLMYAFEHGLSQFVEFETGRFVGVNTDYIQNLKPTSRAGSWRLGEIK